LAALVHGSFAVQMKLYPIIYLPSIFLSLSSISTESGMIKRIKSIIFNARGHAFVLVLYVQEALLYHVKRADIWHNFSPYFYPFYLSYNDPVISCTSFLVSVLFWYKLYGPVYVQEALLYHVKRADIWHNFSPYFYPFYLSYNDPVVTQFIGLYAFVPQILLIAWIAFSFHEDLPFCWFLTTLAFVSLNKVCTSQYFVWYICLLPIAQRTIEVSLLYLSAGYSP
uniref:GPI alpha-1,4-mannosyltransferase I, catalytic subunit n=1 Tax=Gongylonema pulchrum TaxID=637853 RepID=A0A183ESE0_9BILA